MHAADRASTACAGWIPGILAEQNLGGGVEGFTLLKPRKWEQELVHLHRGCRTKLGKPSVPARPQFVKAPPPPQ